MALRIFLFSTIYKYAREPIFTAVPGGQSVISSQNVETNHDLKKHSHTGGGDRSRSTVQWIKIIKQDRDQKPPLILQKHEEFKNKI